MTSSDEAVLTWFVGGLNYHKEHKSFAAGIAAHYRRLRRMGAAD